MKKENIVMSESEAVIKKLTGQVGVDKEFLISSIQRLRAKNVPCEEIEILGKKLYEILLENGLNESDIINPERLISKVDSFLYEGKFEKCLEILEVLDAVEPCNNFTKDKIKVYYVDNIYETELTEKLYPNTKFTQKYVISRRPVYLNLKTQILIEMGKTREAENVIKETLNLSPANFDALMFRAELLKNKNLEKYKLALMECYKVSYTKQNIIAFYRQLAYYYEKKNLHLNAYMVLQNINNFEDENYIKGELDRLELEMNKTAINRFVKPTSAEITRFFANEKLGLTIPPENLVLLVFLYQRLYLLNENQDELNYYRKILLELNNNKVSVLTELEKLALRNKDLDSKE